MSFFPSDRKKLKTRIRTYERALKSPNCDDGYGKRFLVGTMYLLLGDSDGAIHYYNWYTKQFPGDGIEPLNHLSWVLALYRTGNIKTAEIRLKEAVLENLHIWDWLLGGNMTQWDIWYGSNFSEPQYLEDAPSEYINLWQIEELEWARVLSTSEGVAVIMEESTSIRRSLKNLVPGNGRTRLVKRLFEIQDQVRDSLNDAPTNVVQLRSAHASKPDRN